MKNLLKLATVPTIVAIATLSTAANAFVIDFGTDEGVGGFNISEAARTSIGASHQVEITENASGEIEFKFTNTDATYDSTIADIYFGTDPSFGTTFDFIEFTDAVGAVSFSEGASPSDPPPGSSTFASFSADADAPVARNGIGNGEALTFVFDNISDPELTFADIENGFLDGTFQIITHVQSIDGGEGGASQYFVSNPPSSSPPPSPVPEPSSLALLGLGLVGVGLSRRRLARK